MSGCKDRRHFTAAQPTTYNGFLYDSKSEAKVAELLDENNIKFLPHRTYDITLRNGEEKAYTVDFVLLKPVKFKLISRPIVFLDYFGVPEERHKQWMEALCFWHDLGGYVAGGRHLSYWKCFGMLTEAEIPTGRPEE